MWSKTIKVCKFCKHPFTSNNPTYHHCSLKCRFWDKVAKLGPDDCWNWTGVIGKKGYGQFQYKGSTVNAPRMAWILTYGPIPKDSTYHGICILHHCDNPLCCNPCHLFLGTIADNAIDMVHKFRQRSYKPQQLTKQQVKQIKSELDQGIIQRIIAKKYKVAYQTINNIKFGRRWSHV